MDLTTDLQITGRFKGFPDEDGEELIINLDELVYIESPKAFLEEDWEMISDDV